MQMSCFLNFEYSHAFRFCILDSNVYICFKILLSITGGISPLLGSPKLIATTWKVALDDVREFLFATPFGLLMSVYLTGA